MGAKNIRIFGDRVPETPVEVSQTLDWEAEGIRACDGLAGDAGVALCLETHGNLIASYVTETLHRAEAQNTFANWHAAHHVRHGEPVNVAYVHLRGKVRHAHVNFGDSGPLPDTEKDSLTLLSQDGYDGVCFHRGYQSAGFRCSAATAYRALQRFILIGLRDNVHA